MYNDRKEYLVMVGRKNQNYACVSFTLSPTFSVKKIKNSLNNICLKIFLNIIQFLSHKKCILERHFYNFKCFKLILKVSFKDTFFIILKILNLS